MIGYLFAIISSIFFSLYVIPRKISKLSPTAFSFFMSIGFSLSSVLFYVLQSGQTHENFSPILIWSVVAGIIWATSFVLFIRAIDAVGLSRSNQWKNLQGPIAVFLGILILGEFAVVDPVLAIVAAAAIFISAIFLTVPDAKRRVDMNSIYLAILAAVGFGTVAVIQKYVTSYSLIYSQQLVWSLSITASLFIYTILSRRLGEVKKSSKREVSFGLLAGVLYTGASIFQILSYTYLPVSIGFTIIQMNTLWTLAIGVIVFKEIDTKKYFRRVILGILFTLIGITFLALAIK